MIISEHYEIVDGPVMLGQEQQTQLDMNAAALVLETRGGDRPCHRRRWLGCKAQLQLHADSPELNTISVHLCDANEWMAGFLSRHTLQAGQQVTLVVKTAAQTLTLEATVGVCREFNEGCFEGVLRFRRQCRALVRQA